MNNKILESYIKEKITSLNKKVLLENPFNNINKDTTYGELKSLLNKTVLKGRAKKGGEVIKAALGFTPVGGALDVAELIKSLASLKDENRPSNFMANFDVDDDTSSIVDNDLENDFIKELVKKINNVPDDQKLANFNMTDELRNYLSKRFNKRTVKGYKHFSKK